MAFNTARKMTSAIGEAKKAARDARLFAREFASRAAYEQHMAEMARLEDLRGRYRDRSERPVAEDRLRSRSLSPGRRPRPERTPSPWVAQEIANILGYGLRMDIDIDIDIDIEVTNNDEMDVDMDDFTDMEIDSDPPTSMFSSPASSGVSSYTSESSPPTTLSFGPAPVIIDFDEVMIDVQDAPEEHTDNTTEGSGEVPADWLKATHNPGLFNTPTPCKVWTPTDPPVGPHPLTSSVTPTSDHPAISAEPSREEVKAARVDYYARARDEDFIATQRQAERTPLPRSKPKGKKPQGKRVNAVLVDYYARARDEDFIETQRQAERTPLPRSKPKGKKPKGKRVNAVLVDYYARARDEDFIETQRQAERTPLPRSKPKGKKPQGKRVNAVLVDYYARAADEDFIETQRQAERTALPDSEPSDGEVDATPVDYHARAADEDFIEAQRQGESTALPDSDDEELEDGTGDVLKLAANIPLPASEEMAENMEDEQEGVMDQEVGDPAGVGRDEAAQEEETAEEQSHAGTIQVSADPHAVPHHDSAESENLSQDDPTIATRPQVASDVDMTPHIENNPPTSQHENLMEITFHSEIPAPQPEPEPESAQIEGMDITSEEDMVLSQHIPQEIFSELQFPTVLPEMEPEPTQMEGMDITQDQGIPHPSDPAPVEITQDMAMDDGGDENEEYDGPWEDIFDINAPGPRGVKRKRDGCCLRDIHPDDQHAEMCYFWDGPEDDESQADEAQADEEQGSEEQAGEESIEDSFRYDVGYGQALMEHFIRHRLPEVAARVMFSEARYNDNVRADEAQRFASWLAGLGLREAGRDLIEQAFEDQEEMSATELIDLFWDWYEEQVGAPLDTYEVSLVEEDINKLDVDLEEALWDYFDEHPPEEDA